MVIARVVPRTNKGGFLKRDGTRRTGQVGNLQLARDELQPTNQKTLCERNKRPSVFGKVRPIRDSEPIVPRLRRRIPKDRPPHGIGGLVCRSRHHSSGNGSSSQVSSSSVDGCDPGLTPDLPPVFSISVTSRCPVRIRRDTPG
jgi:hypothetical protein